MDAAPPKTRDPQELGYRTLVRSPAPPTVDQHSPAQGEYGPGAGESESRRESKAVPGAAISNGGVPGAGLEASTRSQSAYQVYGRRWYVLAVYALLAGTQSFAWASWGPVTKRTGILFGWDYHQTPLLLAWGPIMYLVSIFPTSWLLHNAGKDSNTARWGTVI